MLAHKAVPVELRRQSGVYVRQFMDKAAMDATTFNTRTIKPYIVQNWSFVFKSRKHRKSRKVQGYYHPRNAGLNIHSGFSVAGLFRRPGKSAVIPKHGN